MSDDQPSNSELEGQARYDPSATPIASAELAKHLAPCLHLCRCQGYELTLLRLSPDAPLAETDSTTRAAITQTLSSISSLRAARLYQLESGDYLAAFCGELPDQARRIGEDYRQSIVDLNLQTGSRPMTVSIGMCSGPPDSKGGVSGFMECATAQLEVAQNRGGNRVEARQIQANSD